ncbi:type VII secretion protein EccE [Nocardia sp. NBC_01327]|uniref:type VII secretion protein EccE n=1 Tax=Nocardia sp. NBC_01327 TaxID=2903593 RepID=UPI002E1656BB|nr:type VII secretion protein EccE [Nocardia sp. NBC_01327]
MSSARIGIGGISRTSFAVLVIGGGPVLAWLSASTPWWTAGLVVSALLTVAIVRVRERTAAQWLVDRGRFRFGLTTRARRRSIEAEVIDVDVAAGLCGIVSGDSILIAMIELAPNLDLPTIITEQTIYTEDTLPIDLLLPMLEQYGITLDIDIVATGRRARQHGGYSMVYDQLIGSHPVVGERLTRLVVRLDLERNLVALTRRGPCAVSGPRALAVAAQRISEHLRERGIAAQVLPASAVREATESLHEGVRLPELRETWNHLDLPTSGRRVSCFAIDWSGLAEAGLDDCWRWNQGWTTLVIGLSTTSSGARGLVRFIGPEPDNALPAYLLPLHGLQSSALQATLPGSMSVHHLPSEDSRVFASAEILAGLDIPIGPNGQIVGTISGQPHHTLALPLFDPAHFQPRRRAVDIRAMLPVAQQFVLRTMVVGASIEIHSARPERWLSLVAAVGDPLALRLAPGPDDDPDETAGFEPATVEVFDQVPPRGSGAQTTVTIGDPGTARRKPTDLLIEQIAETTVEIGIPMRTVRVDLIEPRGETRYFEPAADPLLAGAEAAALAPMAGA